ncbi:unnamed protein product [Didymodactylos carnosus]|uniref:Enhancer of mRNA-decapping protein 3 n=1 Tax=Didymodactylos carnosus TaxID=1234261 RepID=A0A813U4Y0_9BILA|nr:unnamed protein product [Didymodactylos carnosus]CAF0969571.1 unnamed protein product [Didymodactylos carnosus]CAF3608177.1 unnamed protein product [Didymodactylos carnosus]CAF3741089.1 unnamed protein product [Didymodactylos carnosus]
MKTTSFSMANFINWTVSIDCGQLGFYQGQIKSVGGEKQTLTLKNAFRNGMLCDTNEITIKAADIVDICLIADPNNAPEVPKVVKAQRDEAQAKPAPVATNGNNGSKSSRILSQTTPPSNTQIKRPSQQQQLRRSRSSKSWSDSGGQDERPPTSSHPTTKTTVILEQTSSPEKQSTQIIVNNNQDDKYFDFETNLALFNKQAIYAEIESASGNGEQHQQYRNNHQHMSHQTQKYRCDQMILGNNDPPIYEQIILPNGTTKVYTTDEGLLIPCLTYDLRQLLFSTAEQFGYTLERQIEAMGRCCADMCLHLLGGSHRLSLKNSHQRPIVVVLAYFEVQGAYAICCARLLATRNAQVYLYMPDGIKQTSSAYKELQLFKTTQGILTNNVNDLPHAPVDLLVNGLDSVNDQVLFAKIWYRDLVSYSNRLQANIIGIDPPMDGGAIGCKWSLLPVLPLHMSKNVGRLYLCDLGFGRQVYEHCQIQYQSPFTKSFIPLHDDQ